MHEYKQSSPGELPPENADEYESQVLIPHELRTLKDPKMARDLIKNAFTESDITITDAEAWGILTHMDLNTLRRTSDLKLIELLRTARRLGELKANLLSVLIEELVFEIAERDDVVAAKNALVESLNKIYSAHEIRQAGISAGINREVLPSDPISPQELSQIVVSYVFTFKLEQFLFQRMQADRPASLNAIRIITNQWAKLRDELGK